MSQGQGFEALKCYQMAIEVMKSAHQLAEIFPADEKYDLVQQLRRSSKSTCSNIAEGYGRYQYRDALRFYAMARGSLNETISHLIVAKELEYISSLQFQPVYELCRETEQVLNGFMNYVRREKLGRDQNQIREDDGLFEIEPSNEQSIHE